jgi:hypothetical protein
MLMKFSVGQAFSVEGRDAVARAVYEARLPLGNTQVNFAIVIASVEYDFKAVFNSAKTQIGDIPIIGFSTTGELTRDGSHRRSVVVALMVDDSLDYRSEWLPGFSNKSVQTMRDMFENLSLTSENKGLLLFIADGLNGEYEEMVQHLPPGRYQFAGGLAAGDLRIGRTHQMGGNRSGEGGLAAAFISGKNLNVGIGSAHGWHPVGASFRISSVSGPWLRTLDDAPATDGYSRLFGRAPQEWISPPLNTLVRLYPLGITQGDQNMIVRTPLRVESDGSLRMSANLKEGALGQLLVGSRDKCISAARDAAMQALNQLGDVEPKFALVLADMSWQMLFQGYEGTDIEAIRDVIGMDVPIAGGYTFGQFAHMTGAPRPEFLNQHIEIVLFG